MPAALHAGGCQGTSLPAPSCTTTTAPIFRTCTMRLAQLAASRSGAHHVRTTVCHTLQQPRSYVDGGACWDLIAAQRMQPDETPWLGSKPVCLARASQRLMALWHVFNHAFAGQQITFVNACDCTVHVSGTECLEGQLGVEDVGCGGNESSQSCHQVD